MMSGILIKVLLAVLLLFTTTTTTTITLVLAKTPSLRNGRNNNKNISHHLRRKNQALSSECSVCGESKGVTNPEAIFSFPGQPAISCGDLQDDGQQGNVSPERCDFLPTLITPLCGCQPTAPTPPTPTSINQPIAEVSGCSVCGDGKEVTNLDAIFSFPGQPAISCGDLQNDGENGDISDSQCEIYPTLITPLCDCQPIAPTPPTPTPTPISQPTAEVSGCSVCGNGKEVTNPDAIFSFPGQPAISCGDLQDDGEKGDISDSQCGIFPTLITPLCDCQPIAPTPPSPTSGIQPTAEVGGCSVCGDGKEVTNPEAIFSFPGQPARSCGDLQEDGKQGNLVDECDFLPTLIVPLCGCQPVTPTPPSPAPTTVINQPTLDVVGGCSVCGDSKEVTEPEAIYSFPGQPSVSCGNLQEDGEKGNISAGQCDFLPTLITNLCGCQPVAAPKPSTPPTSIAPPSPTTVIGEQPRCSVCGDDKEVTNEDAIFSFPGQPLISCAYLQDDGETGNISAGRCAILPTLITPLCGCQPIAPTPPSPITVNQPTQAADDGCSVCGDSKEVTNSEAIFSFPGQPSRSCAALQEDGENGNVSEGQCQILPALITPLCGCQPIAPSPPSPTSVSQPTVEVGCSVCGDGKAVTNPEAIFSFPGQPTISCEDLQDDGEKGDVPESQCGILPTLIAPLCGCQPIAPSPPSPTTVGQPTEEAGCSVCGDGKEVTNPEAIFSFPGQPATSCGDLQDDGEQGDVSESQCGILPTLITPLCGCQPIAPSPPSPTTVMKPTVEAGCSVCGDGKAVTNLEAIFSFPGQPATSCGDLQDDGEQGNVSESQCGILPTLITPLCGCQPIAPPPLPPTTVSQPAPEVGCSVCGDGKEVTNPEAIFSFPGQPATSCGNLQDDGEKGNIAAGQCAILPTLVTPLCDCQPVAAPTQSSPAVIIQPTPAPDACSVCGDSKEVTNPEAIFSFPGQPATSCGDLQEDGRLGDVPVTQCGILPDLITPLCGCEPIASGTLAPTKSPILSTTSPPSKSPTLTPTKIIDPSEAKGCSVCGVNKEVTNPDAIFSFPGQPAVSCGELQENGQNGDVSAGQCEFLPTIITPLCDCRPLDLPITQPSPTPVSNPTAEVGGCSICGNGKEVTNPEAIFSFPGQPAVSCGNLQDDGGNGDLSEDQCSFLPNLITPLCGCQPIAPSSPSPITVSQPITELGCSVCGDGKAVTNSEAIFSFPGQTAISCGDLQDDGETGDISESQCGILPALITPLCDCQPIAPKPPSPTTIIQPTLDAGCSVCGDGKEVTIPEAVFSFPGQPAISCGDLQDDGKDGNVSTEQCDFLPTLITPLCGCQEVGPIPPSSAPVIQPTADVGCSVCGDGKEVTNPEAIFSFPGQPAISCGDLQDDGENGDISDSQCGIYPTLITPLCDCQPIAPKPPSPTTAIQPTSDDGCSICGDGKEVTNPEAVFSFPGQPAISCGDLQDDGKEGNVSTEQCDFLPTLITPLCGCEAVGPMPLSPAPVVQPTAEVGCSVCGDGKAVTNPESIFSFPGQPATSCGDLQADGEKGDLSADQCAFLPDLITPLCGCQLIAPTSPSPTTAIQPTVEAGCSVCGDGKVVTNPESIFSFPGQPAISCGDLQADGEKGDVSADQCDFLPDLITPLCGCQPIAPTSPSPTAVIQPTVEAGCSVCGDGKAVTNPESIFSFPGQPATSCGDLQDDGEKGDVSADQCDFLPDLITPLCGCQPIAPTSPSPTTVIQPTVDTGCSVCGNGKEVTNPESIFSFPGQPAISCGDLQDDGENGDVSESQCGILPSLITPLCGCQPIPTNAPTLSPTLKPRPTTLTPSQSPTERPTTSSPSVSFAPSTITDLDLAKLLPFLDETADEEFYMVELLHFNDREADALYTNLLVSEVFPSIGAEIVINGTILSYKDFYVVKYPSGNAYREGILENKKVQDALVNRQIGLGKYYSWATKLIPKPSLPVNLTDPPLEWINDPFPPPEGFPTTLFFHGVEFAEITDYVKVPFTRIPESEQMTTGREAVAKFDELAGPIKAEYGIRAVAWLDVKATIAGSVVMDEIRVESIPSLEGLGEGMQTDIWLKAAAHRWAGVTYDSITAFAQSNLDISQYSN